MTSSMRPTDHSPDSTSRLNVKVTPEHKFQQQVKVTPDRKVKVTAVDIQSEDDLVFDRDPEETFDIQRSKLKRKRGRRSRYCEVGSPFLIVLLCLALFVPFILFKTDILVCLEFTTWFLLLF